MLAGIFESFSNKGPEVYEVDPAHFISALRLALKVYFKKTKVGLELLTDADIEEGKRVMLYTDMQKLLINT